MDAITSQADLGELLYAATGTQASALEQSDLSSHQPPLSSSFSPAGEDHGEREAADAQALLGSVLAAAAAKEEAGNGEDTTSEDEGTPPASGCLDETEPLGEEGQARVDFLAGAGATSAIDIAAARRLFLRTKQRHVCHVCGRECPSKHKLKRHLSTHSEERPFNCQLCGKNFKWTEYLAKHMRQQHPGAVSEPALEDSFNSSIGMTSAQLAADGHYVSKASGSLGDVSRGGVSETDMSIELTSSVVEGVSEDGGGVIISATMDSDQGFAKALQAHVGIGTRAENMSEPPLPHALHLQNTATLHPTHSPILPPSLPHPHSLLTPAQHTLTPQQQQDVATATSLLASLPPPELIPVPRSQVDTETVPSSGAVMSLAQAELLHSATAAGLGTDSSEPNTAQATSDLLQQFGLPMGSEVATTTSTGHALSVLQVQTVEEFPDSLGFTPEIAGSGMGAIVTTMNGSGYSLAESANQMQVGVTAGGGIMYSTASQHSVPTTMHNQSQFTQGLYQEFPGATTTVPTAPLAQEAEVTVLTDATAPLQPAVPLPSTVATPATIIIRDDGSSLQEGLPPPAKKRRKESASIGIQCEVGHETLVALKEEEAQAQAQALLVGLDINTGSLAVSKATAESIKAATDLMRTLAEGGGEGGAEGGATGGQIFSPGGDTDDSALDKSVQKYPCELRGCTKAYIHRKDLIRHMKIRHGVSPQKLEPVTMETPEKPFYCQIAGCNRSYFHLKDLRRHQRQCHLVLATGDEDGVGVEVMEGGERFMLRYPCDVSECARSYVHKKDLVRHKRLFHKDAANKPFVPEPVRFTEDELLRIRREEKFERSRVNVSFDTSGHRLDSTGSVDGTEISERDQDIVSLVTQGVGDDAAALVATKPEVTGQTSSAVAAAESLLSVAEAAGGILATSTPLGLAGRAQVTSTEVGVEEVSVALEEGVAINQGPSQDVMDAAAVFERFVAAAETTRGGNGMHASDGKTDLSYAFADGKSTGMQLVSQGNYPGGADLTSQTEVTYDPASVLTSLPAQGMTGGTATSEDVNQLQAQQDTLQSVVSSLQLFSAQATTGDIVQGSF